MTAFICFFMSYVITVLFLPEFMQGFLRLADILNDNSPRMVSRIISSTKAATPTILNTVVSITAAVVVGATVACKKLISGVRNLFSI